MRQERVLSLEKLQDYANDFVDAHPHGAVVGLRGDLGAGKTAFVRAVVASIARRVSAPAPKVSSPSFVIHQTFPELSRRVDHFDLYRLDQLGEKALEELGLFEAIENTRAEHGFVFVEWPERAGAALPITHTIEIKVEANGARIFSLSAAS